MEKGDMLEVAKGRLAMKVTPEKEIQREGTGRECRSIGDIEVVKSAPIWTSNFGMSVKKCEG